MSPDSPEVRRFLARCRVVRIATLSAKGTPHITPLWFVTAEGRVYMGARAESPAARNVVANPRAVLLFDTADGEPSDPVLRMTGTAVVKRGAAWQKQGLLFARKYILSPGDLRDTFANVSRLLDRVRYYAERGNAGMIEVTPESAEFLAKPWT
jgi:hypothetical protein